MNDNSYTNWNAMSDNAIAAKIGEFVKQNRIEQNKTQERLAIDANISRSTLSLLERGETITVTTLIQVLRVLDKLQVFDSFIINRQASPIELAKAGIKTRKRAISFRQKKEDNNEETEW